MAKPVAFLSSTIRDLGQLRINIGLFLEESNFEVIRSEIGSIPYDNIGELEEDCYKEVGNADTLIGILSSEYGSPSYIKDFSITQLEIKTALELNKFVYIFITDNVLGEYYTYLKNDKSTFVPNTVSDTKIFDFIHLLKNDTGAIIHGYDEESDITTFLKNQWSGLLKRQFKKINKTIVKKESIEQFILRDIKEFNAKGQTQAVFWYKKIFSGYLWHRGKLNERIKLGEYVEETAIRSDNLEYLSEALIDDIGWSWVLLKELDKGQKYIENGKRFADEIDHKYYSIKSKRHLSAIDFERGKIEEALSKLDKISKLTNDDLSGKQQQKMMFGINYAKAKIAIVHKDFEMGLESINVSRGIAKEMSNEFKEIMTYSIEGKILELKKDIYKAQTVFLNGLKKAQELSMYDEMIKNCAGLISVYKKRGNISKSNEYIERAKQYREFNTLPFEIGDSIFDINELVYKNEKIATIIRHGFCEKNSKNIIGGDDSELLPSAFDELEASYDQLKEIRYDIILCSPKKQCIETADFLSHKLNVPFKISEALEPASMGVADGLSESELKEKFPDVHKQLTKWRDKEIEAIDLKIPNMTNPELFFAKGTDFLEKIYRDYSSVLIVGTSSTAICLVNIILGRSIKRGGNYKAVNFSNSDFVTFSKNGKYEFIKDLSSIHIIK